MNFVWLLLLALAVVAAIFKGTMGAVSDAAFSSANTAVQLALGLVGGMTLFLGLMRVAQDAGLVQVLARALRPVLKWLFPGVPKEHPALGSIALNMGANMLGLGDAATPMGLKAMQDLQELNPDKDTATDAMCMFMALHSSSIQLIPVIVISLRAAAGSKNPAEIIIPTLLGTLCAAVVAVLASKLFSRLPQYRRNAAAAVKKNV
ncbi:MAG: nucleoside recognition protein [Candidatus Firestonebacteria bacterium]|nr:nucleoside recognition protein [Candidatus Firestonebacteria bacterium]